MAAFSAAMLVSGAAWAQTPEAEPAPAPPSDTADTPSGSFSLPSSVTPISDERPMRFVMGGGNVVVGRRIGEDADFFWILIDGRPARVRKSEVASMDYRVDEPAPSHEREAQELPPPLDSGFGDVEPRRHRGTGLVIGGSILFGLFYLGSAVYAPSADGPGGLLLIPVFGPIFYGFAQELGGDDMAVLVVASVLQAGGALMVYFGLRQMAAGHRGEARRAGRLAVWPYLTADTGGLAAAGRF
jgi:hypothetical protein